MPKKTDDEKKRETETQALNEYLAEESADEKELDEVNTLVQDDFSSVTKLLNALAEVLTVELGDEVGGTMVREFRIKFAKHEMETQ